MTGRLDSCSCTCSDLSIRWTGGLSKMPSTSTSFFCAGVSGCLTTCCVHPLDVIRIRMQLDSEGGAVRVFRNPWHCATSIAKADGLSGVYAGIGAGIFRQLAYGMPRMAFYTIGLERASEPGKPPSFAGKMAIASAAGAAASMVGVPADVCMVRMAADAKAPVEQRRNYSGVMNAMVRIGKEEGVGALWSAWQPTLIRATLLNAGQLGGYSEAKQRLEPIMKPWGMGGLPLQFMSGLFSGASATFLSCPADVLKSRLQNASPGQYVSMVDCATKLLKFEGPLAFWKGSGPSVMKLAPQSVISLVILDNLTCLITGKQAL